MEFTSASVSSSERSCASGPCELERRRVVERRRALSAEGVVLEGLRSYDIGDDLGGVLTLLLTMVTDKQLQNMQLEEGSGVGVGPTVFRE